MGTQIHCRSIFLQGLLLSNNQQLHPYFNNVREKINIIKETADQYQISPAKLCLLFVLHQDLIDKVILGVDSVKQVEEHITTAHQPINTLLTKMVAELKQLEEKNEQIIIPSLWKNL